MALKFTPPPDWLVQEYNNRPQPAEIAGQGIGQAISTYETTKAARAKESMSAVELLAKLYEAGGSDLVRSVGAKYFKPAGLTPNSFPSDPQPPTPSTGPVPSPTPMAVPSNQTPPSAPAPSPAAPTPGAPLPSATPPAPDASAPGAGPAAPQSPIVAHSLFGGATPGQFKAWGSQGKHGDRQRKAALDEATFAKASQDIAGNEPIPMDRVRANFKTAGHPELADALEAQFGKDGAVPPKAYKEQLDVLTSMNQGSRGQALGTIAKTREIALRDSLIKEGRQVMDPYFQTGEGRNQAQRLNSIGRTETLITQMLKQKDGGDPRQMRELATRVDSILRGSPGGQQAVSQINELVPDTLRKKYTDWLEFYSNDPKGTEQQAFINRYADTIKREKSVIQDQVRKTATRAGSTLRVLKEHYPEDYESLMDTYMNHSGELMGSGGSDSGEVVRQTKDGKKAVFDSKTRAFLRYEE